ncbi:MAG TPA: saccharopine dehydrogenase C-terminal domain-containing protein [Candidatus Thermoplasmatota archaeon]|nr:saccharopine dehydrogenase C-terminal domain-containing protein [Candidatus Thermoplasmatota archaeon]
MKVLILGAGMMGRAIAYDLSRFSDFDDIVIGEKDRKTRLSAKRFLQGTGVKTLEMNAENSSGIKRVLQKGDVVISALPYRYNYRLATLALQTKTHFIDLGGNNTIVEKERQLFTKTKKNGVTIIPDSGLAPGLVSIITRDIVDHLDTVNSVRLRVGGLPRHPQPPLQYQIVFSPYGLINEYIEDALILDHGKILQKKSMTEIETLQFPDPFGAMEAFLTSGGCSTLPYTYRGTIQYLDYKTIRYPGHCEKIKTILDLGFADDKKINCAGQMIAPRDVFASLLMKNIPTTGEDVVLLKVMSEGIKQGKKRSREYLLIDSYDKKNKITAMMRTTGYPVAITAQMIANGTIQQRGVFCPEEIIPPSEFFRELKKRDIMLSISDRSVSK